MSSLHIYGKIQQPSVSSFMGIFGVYTINTVNIRIFTNDKDNYMNSSSLITLNEKPVVVKLTRHKEFWKDNIWYYKSVFLSSEGGN